MEIQATELLRNSNWREKVEKEGFSSDGRVWSGWIGSLAADEPVGGGVWPNSASLAATLRHVNFSAGPEIGAWGGIF